MTFEEAEALADAFREYAIAAVETMKDEDGEDWNGAEQKARTALVGLLVDQSRKQVVHIRNCIVGHAEMVR